jgi:response regulator RpfG family c-di-GMP phosphodiesterase
MQPVLGLATLPFTLFPVALTYVAVRRYAANRTTYREIISTLSRMTERGRYTPVDHAQRVAALSVRIGRRLGMAERSIPNLEFAALLHDLGQIALREPIPGGATTSAAPADQAQIAADGAAIVRSTEVLEQVARYIELQAVPYRLVREDDVPVPIESRIIKVANAFDDLTGGHVTPESKASALERLSLGLGYEYDPDVVEALAEVVESASSPRELHFDR